MYAQQYSAGGVLLTLTDEEYNTIILGLDALLDEWVDAGKPMDGFDWISVADRLRAAMSEI